MPNGPRGWSQTFNSGLNANRCIDCFLTQILPNHGCFVPYLSRIKKNCFYCYFMDTGDHNLVSCPSYEAGVRGQIGKKYYDRKLNRLHDFVEGQLWFYDSQYHHKDNEKTTTRREIFIAYMRLLPPQTYIINGVSGCEGNEIERGGVLASNSGGDRT